MEMRILSDLLWGPVLGAFLACSALARLLCRCEARVPESSTNQREHGTALALGLHRSNLGTGHPGSAHDCKSSLE